MGIDVKFFFFSDTNQCKPVYGTYLEEHLRVTDRDIALVIEACVCTLIDAGMEEEVHFNFTQIIFY